MYYLLLVLVTAAVLPVAISSSECDFEPISLALTDVQVLPKVKGSFMRGIRTTIGSPGQEIVMLPWP